MNEIHGVAPNATNTLNELRTLLSGFGPFTSRYILTLPGYKNWHQYLLAHYAHLGEMDQKRLRSILSNAKDRQAFIDRNVDRWPATHTWPINALRIWESHYKSIHVSEEDYLSILTEYPDKAKSLATLDNSEPISPADEEINTEPQDYWNTSKWLCQISAEIHIIDPYINPSNSRDTADVFEFYVEQLSKLQKPTYIHFWTRAWKEITHRDTLEIETTIKKIIDRCKPQKNISFKYYLVDDAISPDKLHARYLITEKGGIKFDQGFQRIRPKGRKNIASPIGENLHKTLFEKFSKMKNEFQISKTIDVRITI